MSVIIHKAVVHKLVKTQHKEIAPSVTRDKVLDPSNDIVQRMIDSLVSVYGTRYNTAQYGIFEEGEGRGGFPDAFEQYAEKSVPTDQQFMDLSRVAMERLYQQASTSSPASGGYIVFADLTRQANRQYLVVMVKERPGFILTESLEPEELLELDLSRVHQGLRVMFGRLSDYQNAGELEKKEIGYLSFVSPTSVKSAAGYFVTALGCIAGAASKRATDTVFKEGNRFFRETEGLQGNREAFKQSLRSFMQEKADSKNPVTMYELAQLVHRHVPDEMASSADDLVEQFVTRLNSDKCQVPPEFPVHSATLNRYTNISGKADNWQVSLTRSALGVSAESDIQYDKERDAIVLRNIPKDMREQIEEEIASRNG